MHRASVQFDFLLSASCTSLPGSDRLVIFVYEAFWPSTKPGSSDNERKCDMWERESGND
jgi:hypothetical protein